MISLTSLPLQLAVGVALLVGVWLHGHHVGVTAERQKQQDVVLKATEAARDREGQWQTTVRALNDDHDTEILHVVAERDAALRSLQQRPSGRLSKTAACTHAGGSGATGRQLSRPDAEFLIRLAGDADRTAADLRACRAWVNTVTAK